MRRSVPVITTVSLTDRENLNFCVLFSAPRWNNLSDMRITAAYLLQHIGGKQIGVVQDRDGLSEGAALSEKFCTSDDLSSTCK